MLLLPSDTLVGQAQPHLAETIKDLVHQIRMGYLHPRATGTVDRYFITEGDTPPFLIDLYTTVDGKRSLFTDMRPFLTEEKTVKRIAARDYVMKDIHSQLLAWWVSGDHQDVFITDLAFAGTVFVISIVTRLTHIYRLDGAQQVMASLILAQWYGQQCRSGGDEYTDATALRDMSTFSSLPIARIDQSLINASRIDRLGSIEALVGAIREKLASPKTAHFNLAAFLVLVKPLVFVYRSDVAIPLSIELPTLFIALVRLAMVDRSMRRSYLFTATQTAMTRAKQQSTTFDTYLTQHLEASDV